MATPIGFSGTFFISPAPPAYPQLSAEEEQYVEELVSMPLYSILTYKEIACKNLGQKIFDQAKATHNGDTFKAKDTVARIYNAISYSCNDASLRMDYIEHTWNGIGDDTWRWIGFKSLSS